MGENNKFIQWRTAAHLTQPEAGQRLGISQAAVSRIERGELQPSPRLALKIEQITNFAVTKNDLRPDVWPSIDRDRQGVNTQNMVKGGKRTQDVHPYIFPPKKNIAASRNHKDVVAG